MTTLARTVELTDEAYRLLRFLNREGESFSDTVRRLAAERFDPEEIKDLPELSDDFDLDEFREEARERDLAKLRGLHDDD